MRGGKQVDQEIKEIKEAEKQEQGGLKELLEPWVRPALIAGVGLAFLQQFIGTNTIIYYAPKRLRMSDLKIRRPFWGQSASV